MQKSIVKRTMALALAGVTCAALAGCSMLLPEEEEMLAPPLVATKEISYETVKVTRDDVVEEKKANGSFRSATTCDVYFEDTSGGRLKEIVAGLGTVVKEGDVLLRMTTDDLEYQYERAKIQHEMQVLNTKNTYGSTARKLADYQLQLSQMEVDRLAKKLEDAELKAPIAGTITFMSELHIGDSLTAYKTYATISDPQDVMMVITGSDAYNFLTGREVTVKIKDQVFNGKIVQNPYDDPNVMDLSDRMEQAYAVVEVYDVPDDLRSLGRDGQITMVESSREDVLTIPTNALRDYNGRTYVQVLQNGVKVERDVAVGLKGSNADHSAMVYEIISGLEEGEEIIIK